LFTTGKLGVRNAIVIHILSYVFRKTYAIMSPFFSTTLDFQFYVRIVLITWGKRSHERNISPTGDIWDSGLLLFNWSALATPWRDLNFNYLCDIPLGFWICNNGVVIFVTFVHTIFTKTHQMKFRMILSL
jgi:hypothetical protein